METMKMEGTEQDTTNVINFAYKREGDVINGQSQGEKRMYLTKMKNSRSFQSCQSCQSCQCKWKTVWAQVGRSK